MPTKSKKYCIEIHQHRFAAWAASRAASVKGCRFSVEHGRQILEKSGFNENFSTPDKLPDSPETLKTEHRHWRKKVIFEARKVEPALPRFTDGVAAKLINVYMKCRFVCGGCHSDERVQRLHPPIDRVLLETLSEKSESVKKKWSRLRKKRWSKFESEDYEEAIRLIEEQVGGKPLWMIEEFWQGNQ